MIAANDLPDLVTNSRNNASFFALPLSGMLHPLLATFEQYEPEFRETISQAQIDFWGQDDGELYALMNFFWSDEDTNEENWLGTNAGFVGRGDIMEDLGITAEDFINPEDMYNALTKVKDAGLMTAGGPVIPFAFIWNMFPDGYSISIEGPDGNLRSTFDHPRTLEWLLFVNRLWRSDLIFLDQFTMNRDVMEELLNRVVCSVR
jgi:ABC-type glycerol-3-phosphate transport system substrate-binding protein